MASGHHYRAPIYTSDHSVLLCNHIGYAINLLQKLMIADRLMIDIKVIPITDPIIGALLIKHIAKLFTCHS